MKTLAEEVGFTQHDARLIAQAGWELLDSGQLESAADIFKGLLALNPRDSFVQASYGVVLKEQGDEVSAIVAFDSAIEEDPKMPVALFNRGVILLKRGNPAGIEDLKAVAALNDPLGERAKEIVDAFAQR